MKSSVYGILSISFLLTCICFAAPEPAIIPAPGQWTVDVEFTHPQQITVPVGNNRAPQRFWYTILTLTNNTGEDIGFYPKCELMTDTFQITPAGRFVTPVVFQLINRRHQSRYPFLEPLSKADNRILQGEDNTKDIAVVWPDFDAQAKDIKIFIAGLSNETIAVDHPMSKDRNGRPVKVFLRKTLELNYNFKGDPSIRTNAELTFKGKRWIMR